jgi:uncharacterized protein YuzE
MSMDRSKKLPFFRSEKAEADFWSNHSPLDYRKHFKEIRVRSFSNPKKRSRYSEANLTIQYDPKARAAYIKVKSGKVARTIEKSKHFFIDLDKKGALLGIEILDPEKMTDQERAKILPSIARHFKISNLRHIHPEYVPQVFAA